MFLDQEGSHNESVPKRVLSGFRLLLVIRDGTANIPVLWKEGAQRNGNSIRTRA